MALSQRARKLFGTVVLLVYIVLYAMLIMTLAASGHVPEHKLLETLFFLAAGILWIFPAKYLIFWMAKDDAS